MKEIVYQLLSAFVGSMGFALIFGMRRRYLFAASLGALLGWGVYLLTESFLSNSFLPPLLAAAFALSYSEIMAKALKTPATLFVVPAIIPLVPGGSLYYTMSYAVHRDMANARIYGTRTLESALAIAAGISFVLAVRELRTKRQG
jgi:uncharacterized membrane protein YjjB (DUF3815 family)